MMRKLLYLAIILLVTVIIFAACGRGVEENAYDNEPPPTANHESTPESQAEVPEEPTESNFVPGNLPGFRGFVGASDSFVTDFDFGLSDFPAIHITTEHYEINRHVRIDGTISVSNVAEGYILEETHMRIRGRGNSSWNYMDKKPFRIRFDHPTIMLDAGHAARDWTFIPNHSDKSLMRNYSAYYMASLLGGMSYAPFARFVDVYFNGEYQGVYMMCIQVNEIRAGRVNLVFHEDPALSEYLLELNRRVHYDPNNIEGVHFLRIRGRYYEIRFPRGDNLTPEHVDYLREHLTRIDNLMYARNPEVFRYIDVPSFIDYYLVQELYKNYDISSLSVFMQIRGQGEERRLEKGPVWDFDISAGNCYYQDRGNHRGGYGPTGIWAGYMNTWFRWLLEIPEYFDQVAARWAHIYENEFLQTIERIEYMATVYQTSFERNFVRWPIMGLYIWPNPQVVVEIDTFMGQVDYLTEFLQTRAAWLQAYFDG